MKIKYVKDNCQNCKTTVDIAVDINADVFYTKSDLASFNFYKNVGLSACPVCGYIAQDITKDDAKNFEEIKNTEKYQYLNNFGYIKDLQNVEKYELDRYAPNIYECYAYYLCYQKDYEGSLRFLFRAVELKEAIIKSMQKSKFLDFEDDEQDERNKIDSVCYDLQKSITKNQKAIVEMYKPSFNVYSKVMYAICLFELGEQQKAQQVYEQLQTMQVEQNLLDYTKSKLEQ